MEPDRAKVMVPVRLGIPRFGPATVCLDRLVLVVSTAWQCSTILMTVLESRLVQARWSAVRRKRSSARNTSSAPLPLVVSSMSTMRSVVSVDSRFNLQTK